MRSSSGKYWDNDSGGFGPIHPAGQDPKHITEVMAAIEGHGGVRVGLVLPPNAYGTRRKNSGSASWSSGSQTPSTSRLHTVNMILVNEPFAAQLFCATD